MRIWLDAWRCKNPACAKKETEAELAWKGMLGLLLAVGGDCAALVELRRLRAEAGQEYHQPRGFRRGHEKMYILDRYIEVGERELAKSLSDFPPFAEG